MEKWDGADGYRALDAECGGGEFVFCPEWWEVRILRLCSGFSHVSEARHGVPGDCASGELRLWRIDAFKIAAERMCGQALAT